MRAIVIRRPGGYRRLQLEELPDPMAGPGQVRVRVEAIGVNFADCVVRMGLYESAAKYVGWPIIPGFEVAGTIDQVGPGVTRRSLGEGVFAVTRFGGYASHVVVPEAQVFPVPAGWQPSEAASFPVVFLTAWYALREQCRLRAGDPVLIHAAAGGVGGAALQLARALGARPIAVVGTTNKVAVASALGAEVVIDRSTTSLWREVERAAPGGLAAVLEPNGADTLRDSYQHLRPTGRLVVYGFHSMLPRGSRSGVPNWLKLAWDYLRTPRFHPIRLTNENRGVLAFNLSYLFERLELFDEAMDELTTWIAAGKVRPLSVRTFSLEEAAEAHRALQSGTTVGKLVLLT